MESSEATEHHQIDTIVTTPTTPVSEDGTTDDVPGERIDTVAASSVPSTAKQHGARDSSWLELEVCREFSRGDCSRSAEECRYAHPTGSVIVKDGKVTCCFDYLKDRCNRDMCKYLHPPNAIKERLVMAGKQYGQAMAVNSKPVLVPQGPPLSPTTVVPVTGTYPVFINGSDMIHHHPETAFTFPSGPPPYIPSFIEVCRDFESNLPCPHGGNCFYAHPEPFVRRNSDDTVSFCWNYLKGYCRHPQCWFYHPPPHIMSALMTPMSGPVLPQVYIDQLMIPYYSTVTKSAPYSPTGSTYVSYPPFMPQYSPTSPTAMATVSIPPVAAGSLPPQTIVK